MRCVQSGVIANVSALTSLHDKVSPFSGVRSLFWKKIVWLIATAIKKLKLVKSHQKLLAQSFMWNSITGSFQSFIKVQLFNEFSFGLWKARTASGWEILNLEKRFFTDFADFFSSSFWWFRWTQNFSKTSNTTASDFIEQVFYYFECKLKSVQDVK